ncbi:hypothetical protein TSUD_346270 [Trifolium subterraneum]|nr:hypothetical protein TSUD_346270 [Trifolium subterraneum]
MHDMSSLSKASRRCYYYFSMSSYLKCIYEKLSDEEVDCCPVCEIDLGILPVEKLRPDHNLQDIRTKIFPFKRTKGQAEDQTENQAEDQPENQAEEVVPSIPLPAKRKERSLSSLVVSAPKVSTHTSFTGKRTKNGTRKASGLRGCSFIPEESIKKEETRSEDLNSSIGETSKKHRSNEDTDNNIDLTEGKADLWTPLNCLVEAANRTKPSRSNLQGTSKSESPITPHGGLVMSETTTKSEPPTSVQSEIHMPKTKNKSNGHKRKFGDDKDGNTLPSGPVKRKRPRPSNQKKAAASEMSASAQLMLDATGSRHNRKNSPIWFTLVASEDQ